MRNLKFRVWTKKTKKMSKPFTLNIALRENNHQPITQRHIVMQYVGIKDKRGKEIYEGDVVKCVIEPTAAKYFKYRPHEFEVGVVFWDHDGFKVGLLEDDKRYLSFVHFEEYEVIGNIYQNDDFKNDLR